MSGSMRPSNPVTKERGLIHQLSAGNRCHDGIAARSTLWSFPILGILMPLVLVPTILVLKHRHQRREWEHKERMKAMEIQLPTPPASRPA